MKKIQRYCEKIQRETEKILFKTFGKKDTIKNYLQMKKELKGEIEYESKKFINDINVNDLRDKPYSIGYKYCKYKTLEKILNIYTESACLKLIDKE